MTIYISGSGFVWLTDEETLEVGQRYHIIGTYDGSSVKLYINGELKAEEEVPGEIGQPENSNVMAIGANVTGGVPTQFANINVYEARVYDQALTADEVKNNMDVTNNRATTWAKTHSVAVTLSDAHSGLATGNTIKYGWSTSLKEDARTIKLYNSNIIIFSRSE